MNSSVVVEMRNITKIFGKVVANEDVNFSVNKGEIHALLGENGAGKSTLMNMLSGLYKPDGGSILIHGEKVNFKAPSDSIKEGIGMVHQHFKLVEVFSAGENIVLGKKGSFFSSKKDFGKEIGNLSERFGIEVEVNKKIYNMSIGEKQNVEILKVLYEGADILILDEPTAVLTPQETKKLFTIMRRMKEQGCAIIIITHKLHEIMEVTDKVTVLRKGKTVGTVDTHFTSPRELTDMMVGEETDLKINRLKTNFNKKLFEVKNLDARDNDGVNVLKKVSFAINAGEILGVAGIAGSGQKELCESIAGIYKIENGEIYYKDENIVGKSSREIIEKGISMSFIPEDRLGMGLVASMDIVDNVILKDYYKQKRLILSRKDAKEKSEKIVKELNVVTPGVHHPVRELSGGNIQKILLGREIDSHPNIIVTAYPTRGLDIGSSHLIYDLLNEEKQKGVGILFVGEDLDVLLEFCDRIMVMCEGEVQGIVDSEQTTKEELGFMMAGISLESLKDGDTYVENS